MRPNVGLGAGEPPLLLLLIGIGLLLAGSIIGGRMWVLDGSVLGGLFVVIGVIVGPILIALGYA